MPPQVSTKLYIGNLPETCRRVELQKMFEQYGEVVECDIVRNYAFVHFAIPDEAKMAQANLDGTDFEGSKLKIELSHSRVRQKPGMGGKGECYRCGKDGHWSKDCPKGPVSIGRAKGPPRDMYPPRGPYARDPYDPYYRDRYLPPPPMDRFDRYRPYPDPYDRRPLPPPPRDPYMRERDPYSRPPPEYYGASAGRRSPPPAGHSASAAPPPRYDPADYYGAARRSPPPSSRPASATAPPPRDPYYDNYYERRTNYPIPPPPPGTTRMSPPRSRVPAPY